MLWILKLSLPLPADQRPSGCFRILVRRLSPPGGNSRKKGLGPASPWWPGQAMFVLKTNDQNHDFSDSTQKRGRMAGQIWFVQHVSWMQGREGVAVMVCTTDVYCPEPGEKPCNCARKVVEKAIFLLSWKRLKGDRKFTILVLGLSSRPIGI